MIICAYAHNHIELPNTSLTQNTNTSIVIGCCSSYVQLNGIRSRLGLSPYTTSADVTPELSLPEKQIISTNNSYASQYVMLIGSGGSHALTGGSRTLSGGIHPLSGGSYLAAGGTHIMSNQESVRKNKIIKQLNIFHQKKGTFCGEKCAVIIPDGDGFVSLQKMKHLNLKNIVYIYVENELNPVVTYVI